MRGISNEFYYDFNNILLLCGTTILVCTIRELLSPTEIRIMPAPSHKTNQGPQCTQSEVIQLQFKMASREERNARERDLTEAIDGFHVSEGEKEGGKKKKKDKNGDGESAEQTKAERKKAMEKALEKARTENGGAPPKLYKKVMELGMQPLYEDLLPKLEAFKSDNDFKKRVDGWNLVKLELPEGQKWYDFREEDFADVTPAEMYRNFLKSDGGRFFQYFLRDKYKDHRSMDCMK